VPVAVLQLGVWRPLFSKMDEYVTNYTGKGYSTLYIRNSSSDEVYQCLFFSLVDHTEILLKVP
jgi:hypothetical protein